MSKTRSLIAAALLSLIAGTANAQTPAAPPHGQPAPQPAPGGQTTGGMMGKAAEPRPAEDRGTVGIFPVLSAEIAGAPAQLIVHGVVPYSPAYYAGIESGDRIEAVDDQPVQGKRVDAIAAAIRGEVGTTVKLRVSRRDKAREITLIRVAPLPGHRGHHGPHHGRMEHGGMMDMMGMHGGMMGRMGGMMESHHGMMRGRPAEGERPQPSEPVPQVQPQRGR